MLGNFQVGCPGQHVPPCSGLIKPIGATALHGIRNEAMERLYHFDSQTLRENINVKAPCILDSSCTWRAHF